MSQLTQKNDFVEIKFTGYANGEIFDSNIEDDLKKLNPDAKPIKTIVVISQGMLVPGLDKALQEKEIGKEYEIIIGPKEGFGDRKREMIKTIPLKAFEEQKVTPRAGLVLSLDNILVKIISVSGARVVVDFNNPLSGKQLKYKFTIVRKVEDEKEKSEVLFNLFFRFVPEFETEEHSVIVKGPQNLNPIVNLYKEKFKELIGKELKFEEKKELKNIHKTSAVDSSQK